MEVVKIIISCILIAIGIGMFAVIFAWWFLHIIERKCSPTDADEERECEKWKHWMDAEK